MSSREVGSQKTLRAAKGPDYCRDHVLPVFSTSAVRGSRRELGCQSSTCTYLALGVLGCRSWAGDLGLWCCSAFLRADHMDPLFLLLTLDTEVYS